MCGSANEVKLCPSKNCSLFPFRLGRNPNIKRKERTAEEQAKINEQMARLRQKKNGGM
jgi:hypothetical protein